MKAMIGTKEEMKQVFTKSRRIPVTSIKAGPCVVTQIKREEKDGYRAVQLGLGEKHVRLISKPMQGHLRGAIKEKKAPRFLCEVELGEDSGLKVGDTVRVSEIFSKGDTVSVSGISKGKGFAGVVKRWGFAGGPKTHGQSDRHRAPGSIGQGTTPGRVRKGKKMAGRMGGEQATAPNLKVVEVLDEEDRLLVSGAVPGSRGTLLVIKKTASKNK